MWLVKLYERDKLWLRICGNLLDIKVDTSYSVIGWTGRRRQSHSLRFVTFWFYWHGTVKLRVSLRICRFLPAYKTKSSVRWTLNRVKWIPVSKFPIRSEKTFCTFNTHKCGEFYCESVVLHVTQAQSQCYMRPHTVLSAEIQKNEEAKILFHDVETFVDESTQLIPSLVVSNITPNQYYKSTDCM